MIDWARVNILRDEIGADDFNEVVALFLDEVDEVMDRLIDAPALANLMQDLHFLKGSALNLGFIGLGRSCQAGERLAAEGQASRVDIAALAALYSASRAAFTAGLIAPNREAG